ncbi:MAG: hypothetical protein HZB87_11475 [Desulfatitalea sp.]|nr:hypothetical protein [Desulfatitalea sp.]MBI5895802.1 hypothetical protein [Desulfobacterales bacterium]
MRLRDFCIWMVAAALLLPCGQAWAAFGEDTEAPKPQFSQAGADWIASLTPRGKSSVIKIRFRVTGGTLTAAAAKTFAADAMPKVDKKNFRSDFFTLQITPSAPGGEAALTVMSDYFSTATELWGPSAKDSLTWQSAGAVNSSQKEDRTNTLTLTLRDGGPLDADGQADGRIVLIFGPRDSFWGYAMGTLLIRFFGVFLVLGVLEVGMLISGAIFQRIEARAQRPAAPIPEEEAPAEEYAVAAETAAAIALALHLNSAGGGPITPAQTDLLGGSPWSQIGRAKFMSDRMPVFDRQKRK